MFLINTPETHPRPGDFLWRPEISPTVYGLVDRWIGDDGQPWIELSDGTETIEDRLFGWQFYPMPGDRVILAAKPLFDLYAHHRAITQADWLWQEHQVRSLTQKPRRGIRPAAYTGDFAEIETPQGDRHFLPTICLAVLSYRYPPTQAQEAA